MGHHTTYRRSSARATLGLCALALFCLAFASPSLAAPNHPRKASLDIPNLNHACGTAVDNKGNLYASSAGEDKVNVYDPSHTLLTSIPNTNDPCGLAVDTTGNLYVSEQATGNVVRYKPNAFPFAGTPTYGPAEPIDTSGDAKGIAVDPFDDSLFVAEGDHVAVYTSDGSFDLNVGEGTLSEASGVAAHTFKVGSLGDGDRYLAVADAGGLAADRLYIFAGPALASLSLRREVNGAATPDGSFGFGAGGAYLAADPGNTTGEGKCNAVAGQACTAGHFFLYDAAHKALDEFDASGEFLARITNAGFADAEPSAIAIERSGGANDGTVYVTAGTGAGAKVLAFGPLAAPSRATLGEPLSHLLAGARAIATDRYGNVYAVAGSLIRVYAPSGAELLREGKGLIEDKRKAADIAVDSTGKVYVLDENGGSPKEAEVTYYTPSAFPPTTTTTYARHEPPIAVPTEFPEVAPGSPAPLRAIEVNPGPGAGRDRLFVGSNEVIHEHDTAANGSTVLNPSFGGSLNLGISRRSLAVEGASPRNGGQVTVYSSTSGRATISALNAAGTEVTARIDGLGCPNGGLNLNSHMAVDQSNGHLLVFESKNLAGREYDRAGACVAEFGAFTHSNGRPEPKIAIDNACELHLNGKGESEPLDETTTPTCKEFDPSNGTAYIAWDDPNLAHPPYDVNAFGPLAYGAPPIVTTGIADGLGGGDATLNGTVNPNGFEVEECTFEYIEASAYEENQGESKPPFEGAEEAPCEPEAGELGSGSSALAVEATVTLPDPQAAYRFALRAANKFGESSGDAALFGAPQIEAVPPLPILYSEVRLRAKVNPAGLPTKYRFDYVDRESFEEQGGFEGPATGHSAWGELAAGDVAVPVSAMLTGLVEGTEYRYRAVAENEAAVTEEPVQAFATQTRRAAESCPNANYRFGLSANLPDCRAYELVTPAQTDGLAPFAVNDGGGNGAVNGFNNWLTVQRGEGAGERLSYFTLGTLPGFEGNGRLDGYRAERGPGDHPPEGWQSAIFSPDYAESAAGSDHFAVQHGVGVDQLYSFWEIQPEPETFPETLPKGIYLRTPSGFEAIGQGSLGEDLNALSRYVSPGGAHAIFTSRAHLEPEAPPASTQAVYKREAGAGVASVVSVPPSGASPALEAEFEGKDASYVGASEDGEAILFSVGGDLYVHREGASIAIAEAPATFAGVSEDGERVFYAAGTGETSAPIRVCDVETGPCAGPGAHSPTEIAAAGIFATVSADGAGALFSSTVELGEGEANDNGEEAEAGARNLYAWSDAGIRFVGRLSDADFEHDEFAAIAGMNLAAWTRAVGPTGSGQQARVYAPTRSTPDGTAFVFQSHARLTAYDNEGAGEIYRYEPAAAEGERLLCVSCDPSGAPPSADALLQDVRPFVNSPIDPTTMIANLTDDGEAVLFQSFDRLVPEDANDAEDVYEWTAMGEGSCTRPGGCLALISSGQGETASFLYAMSADGRDVFFSTKEKLVGSDAAGSPSIYDARIDGGIPEPAAPAPCQGDACQGQGSSPPVIQTPATSGAGEEPKAPEARRCGKGRHRVKGRCVKRHTKKQHRRRAKHDRRTHR